ncbi:hypothetical protein EBCG_03287 [Escherichia marmotae]|nr:hypothetical protein EBCG_03287 [Escherichia marmotae]
MQIYLVLVVICKDFENLASQREGKSWQQKHNGNINF